MADTPILWMPQEGPQALAATCPCDEILYGGARGGGKSDWLCGEFISTIEEYGVAARGIIVRRSFPQLEEIESRLLMLLGPHYGYDSYKRGTKTWHLKTVNGVAELRLRAIEERQDVFKHLGHQYSFIGVDELTLFPDDYVLEQLRTSLRSPYGAPCYVRLTTNPGNVGHNWVKQRFRIGKQPAFEPFEVVAPDGSKYTRVFIPAKVTDNKILMENDPGYVTRLQAIPDPVIRRAYLFGDWDIALGAAFPEFNKEIHIVPSHDIPASVRVWRACDWGYAKPYACGWAYEYDGDIWIADELYGLGSRHDEGTREDPGVVWDKIVAKEKAHGIYGRVRPAYLDPQCWAEHGSTSIVQLLGGKKHWTPWEKGKDTRHNQKMNVHQWLRVINGKSRLHVMDRCVNTIRMFATIPLDEKDPEDVDTNAEDHAYDMVRALLAHKSIERIDRKRAGAANHLAWLIENQVLGSGKDLYPKRGAW